jgi:acyl-coenzyme A synthetase/AMP-(fatty) acid ligase
MLPDVHTTLFTGEALQYAVSEDWKKCAPHSVVENAYGPTETTVWCLFYKLDADSGDQLINGLCPIGDVLDGLHCRIVDEQGKDVPDESRGELWVGGEQIFHGYSNNPDKTKEVLFTDQKGMRWYKTGDIVVRNKQGNIVYVNRKDNQVQVNGYRVELGEVEFAIRKTSGTDGAVVIAVERNNVTELIAFVEGKFDSQKLTAQLAEQLPAYMIPREINSVAALPVNSSGKIDKQKLREQYSS